MSERKWTEAQLSAINSKKKNIILSAAAGSGKTATLTERIIRLLKDESSGAELSRMLIVTFTVAAAGELKERIASALSLAIANDPQNARLTRQLALLESAQISTIDSFFKSQLSPYFSALGLPPDFLIFDTAEAQVLRNEAVADTVRSFFEEDSGEKLEEFMALTDCISTARNEGDLSENLLNIFADLDAYDISPDRLKEEAAALCSPEGDFFKTKYADAVKEHLCLLGRHYELHFRLLGEALSMDADTEKYVPEAQRLSLLAKELTLLSDRSYGYACAFFDSVSFQSLSPIKKGKVSDDYELFKEERASFKKKLESLKADFFSCTDEVIAEAMHYTAKRTETLAEVYERFNRIYGELKREKGGADFADLASFARKIFVSPDGSPTEAAMETGKKYDYIFIDEYQDTNPVQDSIFNAVSHFARRFMVGDVKQSIYGFRGSRPELFTSYRKKYENSEDGEAVFMSENFRSDSPVIRFSNTVSHHIFLPGKTPFEKCDELVCAKKGEGEDTLCEVMLVEKEGEDESEVLPTEAQCVAARISELLSNETLKSGDPIRPKDIAIIMRSGKKADEFAKALSELSIPVNNSASEEFFDHGEVLLVLCLLNTADNPLRDIYLAGSMKSPLFGFSLDDLVNIRESTEVPLWYSLCNYCDHGGDTALREKCISFKKTVDRWRQAARELQSDEMLRLIVSDTSLRSYGGDGVRTNADVCRSLKILSDHARKVALKGGTLSDLISHLNSVIEKADRAADFSDPDSVTILTVHRSKGLEYPVCFLCDTSKKFNTTDANEKLLIDRSGRVAMKLYDKKGLVRCDNPLRKAIALRIKEENSDEEARVLYVALTRARERLIVSCKVKSAAEKLKKAGAKCYFPLDSYDIMSTVTYGDWMIDALLRGGDSSFFTFTKGTDTAPKKAQRRIKSTEETKDLVAFFEKSLDFSYDKEYLWNIPAKLSVSVLKPDILGTEEEKTFFDAPRIATMPKDAPVPSFLSDKKEADGAAKGSATHIFMQFCNLEGLHINGAEAELSRLCEKKFISKEDGALVRLSEIELFRNSDIFKRMLCAKQIIREKRFNTLLPAKDFTEDPVLSKKLEAEGITITVQGVVDCIFIDENGKAVLLDYKTDRLTKEELADEKKAAEKLLSRHARQLRMYRDVCSKMIGRPFDEVCIYSLPLGKTVAVD